MVVFVALALQLVNATPDLAAGPRDRTAAPELEDASDLRLAPSRMPALDPGPFQGRELFAGALGVLAGDALVAGLGYGALRLYARGTLDPSAESFRRTAFILMGSALIVPPLVGVLAARWGRVGPAAGGFWKALLLGAIGHAAALGVGYLASPHYWVIVPLQLAGVAAGASVGLHWGPRRAMRGSSAPPAAAPEGGEAREASSEREGRARAAAALFPVCPV